MRKKKELQMLFGKQRLGTASQPRIKGEHGLKIMARSSSQKDMINPKCFDRNSDSEKVPTANIKNSGKGKIQNNCCVETFSTTLSRYDKYCK